MSQIRQGTESPIRETSGWAMGWTAFASIMMTVQGFWWLMAGLIAVANGELYIAGQEYIFRFDTTTWGWIHLLVGIVVLAAGLGLFSGAVWARTVGVIVAGVAMLIAFAWLPWYPIFAVLFIVVSVSVIWALTAHGRDITTVR